ncbi:hypothetical protein WJX81_001367 [Elliptochloris bilobata]|uniref:Transmembrane protein n=1 Tax=Elliptochloris bilobata TaxID=381761 RepID=A0AAW1QH42_9CHLO
MSNAPPAPGSSEFREVSLASSLIGGLCAVVLGAGVAGGVHNLATAKALREEGIDGGARLRALPIAAKALAVSTAFSVGAVAAALAAAHFWGGLSASSAARVSSWQGALAVAEQQRDLVRAEFQKRLQGAPPRPDGGGSVGGARAQRPGASE